MRREGTAAVPNAPLYYVYYLFFVNERLRFFFPVTEGYSVYLYVLYIIFRLQILSTHYPKLRIYNFLITKFM
jgi:hypothetical protein